MNKRGQEILGLSFGAIFSIIIIIAIIGVAFFAIAHFLSLNNCTQVGLAFREFQDEIDNAWTSGIYRDNFEIILPSSGILNSGIEYVCIGELSSSLEPATSPLVKQGIEDYITSQQNNFFLYPPDRACDGELDSFNLAHAKTKDGNFFCVKVEKGKAIVKLEKTVTDDSVKVSRA